MAGDFNFKSGDVVNGSFGKVYMDGRNVAEIYTSKGKQGRQKFDKGFFRWYNKALREEFCT